MKEVLKTLLNLPSPKSSSKKILKLVLKILLNIRSPKSSSKNKICLWLKNLKICKKLKTLPIVQPFYGSSMGFPNLIVQQWDIIF